MDDLIDWLRAVLDEDEAAARAATPGPWWAHRQGDEAIVSPGVAMDREEGGVSLEDATHIALHDPAAVLADIVAKRAILDTYTAWVTIMGSGAKHSVRLAFVVRTLASGYRYRPGYNPAWGWP